MSDKWQVGDLALCVKMGPWLSMRTGEQRNSAIRCGMILTVSGVKPIAGFAGLFLYFEGFTNERLKCATRFRRIPPHIPDAEDAETIRLLNERERVNHG